jgi:hypothetical protein
LIESARKEEMSGAVMPPRRIRLFGLLRLAVL